MKAQGELAAASATLARGQQLAALTQVEGSIHGKTGVLRVSGGRGCMLLSALALLSLLATCLFGCMVKLLGLRAEPPSAHFLWPEPSTSRHWGNSTTQITLKSHQNPGTMPGPGPLSCEAYGWI